MAVSSFDDPLLQSILERVSREQGFREAKFLISSGSKPGDNYCSRIYRVGITDQENEKTLSLIFKVSIPRKTEEENAMFKSLSVVETNAYETVLPTLNKMLKKYGVSESDCFPGTVRIFASHLEDSCQVLVLEDKSVEGFRMIGETKVLDTEHCRHVLRRLALWHASSMALKHHEPETFESLKDLLLGSKDSKGGFKNPVFLEMQKNIRKGLKLLPESFKMGNAFKKMEKAAENYIEVLTAANVVPPDLECILQGDCWVNNVLYKYNKDNVLEDVCLIDHQGTRIASPAVELSYMFFSCTTKETRDASFDELIQYYHDEVSSLLRKMDLDPEKIIPLESLHEHIKKYGQMGPLTSSAGVAMYLIDCSDSSKPEDIDSFFSGREKVSTDPLTKSIMEKFFIDIITDAYERGII